MVSGLPVPVGFPNSSSVTLFTYAQTTILLVVKQKLLYFVFHCSVVGYDGKMMTSVTDSFCFGFQIKIKYNLVSKKRALFLSLLVFV